METTETNYPDFDYLVSAFERRVEPLARDVVRSETVGEWVRRDCAVKPSNHRIGKLLTGPPFIGVPRKVKIGDRQFRCIVLRNHAMWLTGPAREVMAHINGEYTPLDPLCD